MEEQLLIKSAIAGNEQEIIELLQCYEDGF